MTTAPGPHLNDRDADSLHWTEITWGDVAQNSGDLIGLHLPYMPRTEDFDVITHPLEPDLGPYVPYVGEEPPDIAELPVRNGWVNVVRGITGPYGIVRAIDPDAPAITVEYIVDENTAGIATTMPHLLAVLDPSRSGLTGAEPAGTLFASHNEYPHAEYASAIVFQEGTIVQFCYPRGGSLDPVASDAGVGSIGFMLAQLVMEDAQWQGKTLDAQHVLDKAIARARSLFVEHSPVTQDVP